MPQSKVEKFSQKQNALAAIAKALAHPARIAILEVLAKNNGCICGDIVSELPLAQATVSQHLKALKTAGLIIGSTDGPSICYCINSEVWEKAESSFAQFFSVKQSHNLV